MKLEHILLIILICISPHALISQQSSYFQQEVNYSISVALDDQNHMLNGSIEIEYINNSPDNIEFIYFHLWPNAYKNNQTALARQQFEMKGKSKLFKLDSLRGYIDSLNFSVDGHEVIWEYDLKHIDICKIFLKKPLPTGEKVVITTPFRVKFPKGGISRLGHIDQSYQVTQWYPKPAVYDGRGWHPMPYLDKGEFYSEFGTFDVKITVPQEYTVAAPGELLTRAEIKRLNVLASKNSNQKNMQSRTSHEGMKTLHYQMENVHDFAWFADKNFVVSKDSIKLPRSGKIVTTWAFYHPEQSGLWNKATDYVSDAVLFYSNKVGEYPYSQCTAVAGPLGIGGGMEYPGITIIGSTSDSVSLNHVIMHEVGHNWFYSVLGNNERRYPFLDEGINSYYEMQYMLSRYPDLELHEFLGIPAEGAKFFDIDSIPYYTTYVLPFLIAGKMNFDQSNLLHSNDYSWFNYVSIVYFKSAFILNYLKEYVGEDVMDKAMQHYYEKWKYRHPYPEGFQKSLEKTIDKDISWFFDQMLPTTRKMDYKIKRMDGNRVLIKNSGTIESPFVLHGLDDGKTVFSKWYEPISDQDWINIPGLQTDQLVLDYKSLTPDINRKNHFYSLKGLNKKFEPLKLKFLAGLEDPSRTNIYYFPVIGWNNYNKTMAGLWLHSGLFFKKRAEYQLLPMYGFGNNDIAGSAKLNFFFPFQDGIFRNIDISLSGVRYGYHQSQSFNRISGDIDFLFDNALHKKTFNTLHTRYIFASDMEEVYSSDATPTYNYYYDIAFTHQKKGRVNPYGLNIALESGPKYMKMMMDATYNVSYTFSGGLNIRLFAGKFLVNNNPSFIYDFSLSGISGVQDYKFDHVFLNRFGAYGSGLFTQQYVLSDGGFASFYPGGYSDDWMGAINLTSSIPKIPVKLFLNAGYIKTESYDTGQELFTEGGIMVGNRTIGVYFPMFSSNEISSYLKKSTDNYWQRIRLVLRIEKLNPMKLRELLLFSL